MKRQTIDGKPIYKDELWEKMLEVGNVLLHLGYEEASKKPNLFYKKLYKEDGDYEILFADLRGDSLTPIWEYLRVSLYPSFDEEKGYSCSSVNFGFQEILLRRNISIPINSSFLYVNREVLGYCETCNKDLLLGKDLSKSQGSEDLDPDIELFYCDRCKIQEYNKIREAKLCIHCKEEDWVVEHHIIYEPEQIIRVCNKCHTGKGGIHWWGFPNLLWKQKKKDYEDLKRKRKRKREAKKPQNLTNYHCVKCLRTWSGITYNDYCPDCMHDSVNKLSD